uniref:Homeobox domain-containing protein n=1 Tax=Meloidogyne floridensis TaxID=298350 RepID=A0A915PB93_9BILA
MSEEHDKIKLNLEELLRQKDLQLLEQSNQLQQQFNQLQQQAAQVASLTDERDSLICENACLKTELSLAKNEQALLNDTFAPIELNLRPESVDRFFLPKNQGMNVSTHSSTLQWTNQNVSMTDSATLCTHGQIAPSNVVVTWPHSSYVFPTPSYTFGGSGVNEISNVVGTPQQLLGAPSLQVRLLSLIFSATENLNLAMPTTTIYNQKTDGAGFIQTTYSANQVKPPRKKPVVITEQHRQIFYNYIRNNYAYPNNKQMEQMAQQTNLQFDYIRNNYAYPNNKQMEQMAQQTNLQFDSVYYWFNNHFYTERKLLFKK